MTLVGFFDQSGTWPQHERIILAGYLADQAVWRRLRRPWRKVLDETGLSYFHGKEAPPHGVRVQLGKCLIKAAEDGLVGIACSVRLTEYESVCRMLPHIPSVERIMVGVLANVAIKRLRSDGRHQGRTVSLVFDEGEPFFGLLDQEWRQDRAGAHPKSWAKFIGEISKANPRDSLGLQAADFLAWHARRHSDRRGARKPAIGSAWEKLSAGLLAFSTVGYTHEVDAETMLTWYTSPS